MLVGLLAYLIKRVGDKEYVHSQHGGMIRELCNRHWRSGAARLGGQELGKLTLVLQVWDPRHYKKIS